MTESARQEATIAAPAADLWSVLVDFERYPTWVRDLKQVEVLERDAEGRPEVVQSENDAKVKTVKSRLRFSYEKPHRIEWVQEKGDTKSVRGWWNLEDLGSEGTRATYALEVDPGRMLGMLMKGPVEGQVRDFLLGNAASGLKEEAESRS